MSMVMSTRNVKLQQADASGAALFQSYRIRDVVARNRVVISPMQQYSAVDGVANDWHLLHLARFALGGAGIVFVGSTAVEARGRNTHGDLGLWKDSQVEPLRRVAAALKANGAVPAIQLGHTGRKAALQKSWEGHGPLNDSDRARGEGPWPVVAPSALPVDNGWPVPSALSTAEVKALVQTWGEAAGRAAQAGYEMLEVHGAHGYLIHQFLSPVSNVRTDEYGGCAENRHRFAMEVAEAVRSQWPACLPLVWRMSLADLDSDLDMGELVEFVRGLKRRGVDILDCSSAAGISSYPSDGPRVPRGLEFRADDAQKIKTMTGIDVMAVGLIIDPHYAESLLASDQADLIAIGREALFNPNWAVHAQISLGANTDYSLWPLQYRSFLVKRAAVADPLRNAALHRDALRKLASPPVPSHDAH
ncbi:MAG: NADH:flavin oxidoreductase/NADH oxidase [Burkholderiaceae bacterium]|nr:NADH:flavin oxidoreductase/NADH oxidase [Burkholderiaceae bacterium]